MKLDKFELTLLIRALVDELKAEQNYLPECTYEMEMITKKILKYLRFIKKDENNAIS